MFFSFVYAVEHANKSASCHKGIKSSFMATLLFEIDLDMLVVDIGVRLQQFFNRASFVQRFEIDFDRLHS
jgi:hypothetical protein